MTIQSVNILIGYRFLFPGDMWDRFSEELSDYANVTDKSDKSDKLDNLYDVDERNSSKSKSDQEVFFMKFFDSLRTHFPNVEYNTISCIHKGVDRMIDIGYSIGEFSILGDHEGSINSTENLNDDLKKANNPLFAKHLSKSFIWKYCYNPRNVQLLCQTNDCLYCY
jgi:hypothetical protein